MTWFRSEYVHIILISPGRTTFQRVNWTESGKPVSVTLPTRVPRGAYLVGTRSSPSSRGPQRFHVLSTLHPILVGVSQTGTFSQVVFFLGAFSNKDPGSYDPSIYISRVPCTFPARSCRTLNRPAGMTVASSRIVVAIRDLIAVIHRESRISKPTYTNGLGSGEQPTAQSQLNQVCKLQNRGVAHASCSKPSCVSESFMTS